MRPIAIDLFAGAGGMSLGFEQAGFDVVAAIEIDPIHAATHKYNFPNCAVIPRSIVGLTGTDIRSAANIGKRRVDVVFGGAPCQGFSLIGHRVLDDPRNALVKDFVRIVSELDAKYFVFENVKGLTLGKHRRFLEELIQAFDDADYAIAAPWQVLNAATFGVPQNRERFFLVGAKKSLNVPRYPLPKFCKPGSGPSQKGLPIGPTCRDALDDLPDAENFQGLNHSDEVRTRGYRKPSAYSASLRCLTKEDWHFGFRRIWDSGSLTSSARTEHTDISRRRFQETECGSVEPVSRFYKLSPDGVSNTLRAGTDAARGAFTSPRPIHYAYPRCVTVREMARLHGFPDWFRFHATKWHGARQIGNAVPPPLARAVAEEVIRSLGVKPARPRKELLLNDPELLRMDMGQAAAHFGVPVAIGRRDQKSGATKRKQVDIEAQRQKQTPTFVETVPAHPRVRQQKAAKPSIERTARVAA